MRRLEQVDDLAGFRAVARRLLAAGREPAQVAFYDPRDGQLPLAGVLEADSTTPAPSTPRPRVPRRFLDLAERIACHRDPGRWDLLYRLYWRLAHGEPRLLELEIDDDVFDARQRAKAVHRDSHKMKAFVRFRKTLRTLKRGDAEEWYIAWHRPDHYIVPAVAPFFADRFGSMRWMILTPEASVAWDLHGLHFGPGAPRSAAPAGDELEDLWRTYYASIFNPARLKLAAMRAEMPVKHWATLPEAELIPRLIREAPGRVAAMMKSHQAGQQAAFPAAESFFPQSSDLDDGGMAEWARASQACRACPLHEAATCTVFGEGPRGADIMLIGEQPGDQEDRAGKPFVGPAGRLLDELMAEAGLHREKLYLTNAVKHFKFEERPTSGGIRRIHQSPSLTEVRSCRPWLEEEIRLVRPKVIGCLGATAAKALLGPSFRLSEERGRPHRTSWAPALVATYHPSAVLRAPAERAAQWRQAMRDDLITVVGLAGA